MPKEESASPYPYNRIGRKQVDDLLKTGQRTTMRGVTLYTKPTDSLEVGFLIRKMAGNAVQRIYTRRLFWGALNNHRHLFQPGFSYLFLFHHRFQVSASLVETLEKLIVRSMAIAE